MNTANFEQEPVLHNHIPLNHTLLLPSPAWHEVHYHVHSGDLSALSLLLDKNPACARLIELPTSGGKRPLMLAAEKGHVNVLEYLLDKGADIQAVTVNEGFSALVLAVRQNKPECVQLLLKRGGAEEGKRSDRWGRSPLFIGVDHGSVECVSVVVSFFLGLQAEREKEMKKGEEEDEDVLERLYSTGVQPHTQPPPTTLLLHACKRGHVDVVRDLLKLGADPYHAVRGETPMSLCQSHTYTQTNTALREACRALLDEWERAYMLVKVRSALDAATQARVCGSESGNTVATATTTASGCALPVWFRAGQEVTLPEGEEEEEELGGGEEEGERKRRKVLGGVGRKVAEGMNDDMFYSLLEMVSDMPVVVKEEEEKEEEDDREMDEQGGDW